MNIPTHLAINAIAAIPLSHYLNWDYNLVLIFLLAGVLIDSDHFLFFFFKHKNLSLKEWVLTAKSLRAKMKPGLYIFHSPEFNFILLMLSIFNHVVLTIFLSNIIHISLDIIDHYRYHKNLLWIKEWSIIYALKT